ncbi:MAG: RNA-binding cell elongation regulator Jag/EloR [Bacilli bacterium]|nr:RNA-binding cell elongation regulator Jag/EloR [Bacilli bacterium]
MKRFTAKTLDDAIVLACQDYGILPDQLNYSIIEEKKGLFAKKVEIEVYDLSDAIEFAQEYLVNAISSFGITATTKASLSDDIIKITINSDHNSILIGKNGRTLQALNELTKLAVSSRFKKRYRVLLDIADYKGDKYKRVIHMAKRTAYEVQKTHVDAELDPMTADERRVVHNALSRIRNVSTESTGEGKKRHIVIKYVASKKVEDVNDSNEEVTE